VAHFASDEEEKVLIKRKSSRAELTARQSETEDLPLEHLSHDLARVSVPRHGERLVLDVESEACCVDFQCRLQGN
jgi:hypothetical protein